MSQSHEMPGTALNTLGSAGKQQKKTKLAVSGFPELKAAARVETEHLALWGSG